MPATLTELAWTVLATLGEVAPLLLALMAGTALLATLIALPAAPRLVPVPVRVRPTHRRPPIR